MQTVVGHHEQKKALLTNNEATTWLLCGKRGIGKATLAYAFARYIVKSDTLNSNPDIMVFTDNTEAICMAKVREIQHFLHMKAIKAERKVVVLDGIDDVSTNAANALLKTLEEPPKGSLIILVSHNLYAIPVVIRSRCMILRFSELSSEETKQVIALNFPDLVFKDKIAALYPGTPGMVTGDIEKEVYMYESFNSAMREKDFMLNVSKILDTDLPMYKVEYIALKALADLIWHSLLDPVLIVSKRESLLNMLERYHKVQKIFNASRKLHLHREVTIFRVVETVASMVSAH